MPNQPPATAPTPAHEVALELRQAILEGRLVPNQRLVEADLAAEYETSRGHVRTALSELTVEGLIERVQNRGARVRAIDIDEAVEITEVRGALEALCAQKAAQRVTDEQIRELQAVGERMQDAVHRGDRDSYSEGNRVLHRAIIEISGQQTAAATIQRLRGQAVRFQYQLSRQQGRPAISLPQHLAIIEAVCARDPEAAAEAMRAHLASVADAIRSTSKR